MKWEQNPNFIRNQFKLKVLTKFERIFFGHSSGFKILIMKYVEIEV